MPREFTPQETQNIYQHIHEFTQNGWMSRKKLASDLGITYTHFSSLLRSGTPPTEKLATKIASLLKIPLDALVLESNKTNFSLDTEHFIAEARKKGLSREHVAKKMGISEAKLAVAINHGKGGLDAKHILSLRSMGFTAHQLAPFAAPEADMIALAHTHVESSITSDWVHKRTAVKRLIQEKKISYQSLSKKMDLTHLEVQHILGMSIEKKSFLTAPPPTITDWKKLLVAIELTEAEKKNLSLMGKFSLHSKHVEEIRQLEKMLKDNYKIGLSALTENDLYLLYTGVKHQHSATSSGQFTQTTLEKILTRIKTIKSNPNCARWINTLKNTGKMVGLTAASSLFGLGAASAVAETLSNDREDRKPLFNHRLPPDHPVNIIGNLIIQVGLDHLALTGKLFGEIPSDGIETMLTRSIDRQLQGANPLLSKWLIPLDLHEGLWNSYQKNAKPATEHTVALVTAIGNAIKNGVLEKWDEIQWNWSQSLKEAEDIDAARKIKHSLKQGIANFALSFENLILKSTNTYPPYSLSPMLNSSNLITKKLAMKNGMMTRNNPTKSNLHLDTIKIFDINGSNLTKMINNFNRFGMITNPTPFINIYPEDAILRPEGIISLSEFRNLRGTSTHKYVVTAAGKLIVSKDVWDLSGTNINEPPFVHSNLAGKEAVVAAGTIYATDGQITEFDDFSGHYQICYPQCGIIAETALLREGYTEARGKFVLKHPNNICNPSSQNTFSWANYFSPISAFSSEDVLLLLWLFVLLLAFLSEYVQFLVFLFVYALLLLF